MLRFVIQPNVAKRDAQAEPNEAIVWTMFQIGMEQFHGGGVAILLRGLNCKFADFVEEFFAVWFWRIGHGLVLRRSMVTEEQAGWRWTPMPSCRCLPPALDWMRRSA